MSTRQICGILATHEPHQWQLLRENHEPVPRGQWNRWCDGSAKPRQGKAIIRKDSYGQWRFVVPMPKGAIPLTGSGWSWHHAMELVNGIIKAKWAVKHERELSAARALSITKAKWTERGDPDLAAALKALGES